MLQFHPPAALHQDHATNTKAFLVYDNNEACWEEKDLACWEETDLAYWEETDLAYWGETDLACCNSNDGDDVLHANNPSCSSKDDGKVYAIILDDPAADGADHPLRTPQLPQRQRTQSKEGNLKKTL